MPRKKKETAAGSGVAGVLNELKSRYPGKVFASGEYTMPYLLKRLPTGLLDLDIALQGGLPAGGMTFFTGREGVGKNWLANQVMREQQIRYGDRTSIAVVSTEMVFDKMFARDCGVSVALSSAEIAEIGKQLKEITGESLAEDEIEDLSSQLGDFITVPPSTAEDSLSIAIDLIASREFDLVLIDSFGSLLTEHDEENDLSGSQRVGGAAMLNTRFARKLNFALSPDDKGNPNLTTVIGINQVRDNTDRANKYSPKTIEAGGWALKHARWVTIQMSPVGRLKGPKGEKLGKTIRWEITKQKAGGHEGAQGTYDFYYGLAGVNRAEHTIKCASTYDVVKRSGAWYSYKEDRIGQGAIRAAKYVVENDLLDEIETATLRAADIRCSY
jgi:recombination protein RecA